MPIPIETHVPLGWSASLTKGTTFSEQCTITQAGTDFTGTTAGKINVQLVDANTGATVATPTIAITSAINGSLGFTIKLTPAQTAAISQTSDLLWWGRVTYPNTEITEWWRGTVHLYS